MAYTLPNGKTLKRCKGQKNKMSPTKIAAVHRKLLAVLFDIEEPTVARQFIKMRLSLKNPYAVREYIERKLEYNNGTLGSIRKTAHEEFDKMTHERKTTRRRRPPRTKTRTPQINDSIELGDKPVEREKKIRKGSNKIKK